MIGRIKTKDQHQLEAVLHNDGKWTCSDKNLEAYLNFNYKLEDWWLSPMLGARGLAALKAAAEDVNAEYEYLAPKPKPIEQNERD